MCTEDVFSELPEVSVPVLICLDLVLLGREGERGSKEWKEGEGWEEEFRSEDGEEGLEVKQR